MWAEGMPSIKAPGFWVEQNVRGKVADDSDAVDGCVEEVKSQGWPRSEDTGLRSDIFKIITL